MDTRSEILDRKGKQGRNAMDRASMWSSFGGEEFPSNFCGAGVRQGVGGSALKSESLLNNISPLRRGEN